MTTLDWIIVAFTLLMAAWGYLQGLVVGALSLAGFVAGAFLGSRLAPVLLSGGSEAPYAPLVTLVVAVTLGGVLATALETLGFELRRRMGPALGTVDGAVFAGNGQGLLGEGEFATVHFRVVTPGCGNGVAWRLEHRRGQQAEVLDEGALDLGRSTAAESHETTTAAGSDRRAGRSCRARPTRAQG